MRLHVRRAFAPDGWLLVRPDDEEELYAVEAVPLPGPRAIDLGTHSKQLPVAITSVQYDPELGPEEAFRLEIPRLGVVAYLRLEKYQAAGGVLGGISHQLQVRCLGDDGREVPCDASLILALASPADYPQHAARIFTAAFWAPEDQAPEGQRRWRPWEALGVRVPPEVEADHTYWKRAVDCLRDAECIRALWLSTVMQPPAIRELLYKHGMWKKRPGGKEAVEQPPGAATPRAGGEEVALYEPGYTTSGALALLAMAHLLPKVSCRHLPKGFSCPQGLE